MIDNALKSKDIFNVPFFPSPIRKEELGKGRLFTLRGPRQVGKTRFLKWLRDQCPELRPVYETLDIVRTDRELVALIRRTVTSQRPKLVLLDEISSVPRWQKAFKYLSDREEIEGIDFVLSGSSATDIRRGAERLPGRRGPEVEGGWDRLLLPLDFSQFAKHMALLSGEEIDILHANVRTPALVPAPLFEKLQGAFSLFLRIGGFPISILSHQAGESLPFRTMMGIIRSDFEKRKKSRIILDQVLGRLNQSAGTAMTWESFAKPITATKVITRQYIDELCENYLTLDLECFDLSRNRTAPRKPRKLSWIDPLIPQSVADDGLGSAVEDAAMVEMLVGFELARKYERHLWEGLNQLRHLSLWRDSRGNEVDFVVEGAGRRSAVEVKWQAQVSEWDAKPLDKTFGGGTLLSRDRFATFGKVDVMPVSWFLFFLNGNVLSF